MLSHYCPVNVLQRESQIDFDFLRLHNEMMGNVFNECGLHCEVGVACGICAGN